MENELLKNTNGELKGEKRRIKEPIREMKV